MDNRRRIYYVLIAIEGLNIDNPMVIGIFESRDEAYEERNWLQESDFWTRYVIRAGVMVYEKEGENNESE